ncbi:MAG: DUF2851 family protein [Candidatus Kapabacteria bacterium]|nr:DUF2851 family protein [Candidatus Kapabacteria bacterium]
MEKDLNKPSERELQKSVHNFLSDPSIVYFTKNKTRLQILSPGRINSSAGPDFIEMALLLDSKIIIANGEFHRKSSEWNTHSHGNDPNYDSVALHIVYHDDSKTLLKPELLLLNENEINDYIEKSKSEELKREFPIDELQHYALIRLLRKAAEAQKLLNNNPLDSVLYLFTKAYIDKYLSKQKRPVYQEKQLDELLQIIVKSDCYNFLNKLQSNSEDFASVEIQKLLEKKIHNEGDALRREIILNCVYPPAVCLAGDGARVSLFMWYWSMPSLNKYSVLNKQFKGVPQEYIWQQQGMLEYIRLYGRKPSVASEAIAVYGFADVLSFYRIYRDPKQVEIPEDYSQYEDND